METEEQRARRIKATLHAVKTLDLGALLGPDTWIDAEAELTQIMHEAIYREEIDKEIVKSLKRMYNKAPTVSDKIRRLHIK